MTLLSSTSYILLDLPLPNDPGSSAQIQLNRRCLEGLAPWLEDEFGVTAAQMAATVAAHTTIWPLIDGSAIAVDTTRLIVIPSMAIDQSELRIPQEWVDIPSWVGDYYIAVRINPDSNQLCVWGYTTHAKLKQTARYDADDRSYCLDSEDVMDLAVLLTARALVLAEPTQASVAALPELPVAQADALVQRLTGRLMPRLAVPFMLWAPLLADAGLRSRLVTAPTNLSQWHSRLTQTAPTLFAQGWQTLTSLLPESQTVPAFRASEAVVRRGKRLRLGSGPEETTVILLMAVAIAADEQMSMQVQLQPEPETELPTDLELSLISPAGDYVQRVYRQPLDSYIQLKRFRLPPGYDFTIQVRSGSQTVQEPFTT